MPRSSTQFRHQYKACHLTYKTHLTQDTCMDISQRLTGGKCQLQRYSFVHELGDENEDKPTPYEHTHIFLEFTKCCDKTGTTLLDVADPDDPLQGESIHPHIDSVRSAIHKSHIVLKYHKGHKTKKDGTKYYIEPVWLLQYNCDEYEVQQATWLAAAAAPSLMEGCIMLNIMPRGCADVALIQKDYRAQQQAAAPTGPEAICSGSDFATFDGVLDDPAYSLIVCGNSGTGKTNWALGQSRHAHLVTSVEDLRAGLPDGCDLIVFDDMDFSRLDKQDQLFLLDTAFPRTIKARYSNFKLPNIVHVNGKPTGTKIKRIFTCNPDRFPFNRGLEGIQRRFKELTTDFGWDGCSNLWTP